MPFQGSGASGAAAATRDLRIRLIVDDIEARRKMSQAERDFLTATKKVEQEQIRAHKAVAQEAKKTGDANKKALAEHDAALQRLLPRMGDFQQRWQDVRSVVSNLPALLGRIPAPLGIAVGLAAGFAAEMKAAQVALQAMERGGRILGGQRALTALTGGASSERALLGQLRDASGGQATSGALREAAALPLARGIPGKDLVALLREVRIQTDATGKSFNQTFDIILNAILLKSVLRMDQFGVSLDQAQVSQMEFGELTRAVTGQLGDLNQKMGGENVGTAAIVGKLKTQITELGDQASVLGSRVADISGFSTTVNAVAGTLSVIAGLLGTKLAANTYGAFLSGMMPIQGVLQTLQAITREAREAYEFYVSRGYLPAGGAPTGGTTTDAYGGTYTSSGEYTAGGARGVRGAGSSAVGGRPSTGGRGETYVPVGDGTRGGYGVRSNEFVGPPLGPTGNRSGSGSGGARALPPHRTGWQGPGGWTGPLAGGGVGLGAQSAMGGVPGPIDYYERLGWAFDASQSYLSAGAPSGGVPDYQWKPSGPGNRWSIMAAGQRAERDRVAERRQSRFQTITSGIGAIYGGAQQGGVGGAVGAAASFGLSAAAANLSAGAAAGPLGIGLAVAGMVAPNVLSNLFGEKRRGSVPSSPIYMEMVNADDIIGPLTQLIGVLFRGGGVDPLMAAVRQQQIMGRGFA